MSTDKIEQLQLTEKILALIQDDHTHLSESQLYEVFTQVVQLLRSGIHVAPAPKPAQNPDKPPAPQGPVQRLHLETHEGRHVLIVEILAKEALQTLQKQLQNTGGLWLKLPSALPLNTDLDVCVIVPAAKTEFWFAGRIVVHMPEGTAIDMRPQDPDFLIQWENILRQMGPLHQARLEDLHAICARTPTLQKKQPSHTSSDKIKSVPLHPSYSRESTPLPNPPEQAQETRPTGQSYAMLANSLLEEAGLDLDELDLDDDLDDEDLDIDFMSFVDEVDKSLQEDTAFNPSNTSLHQEPLSRNLSQSKDLPSTRSRQPKNIPSSRDISIPRAQLAPKLNYKALRNALEHEPPTNTWVLGEHTSLQQIFMNISTKASDGFLVLDTEDLPCLILLQMGCPAEIFLPRVHRSFNLGDLLVKAKKLNLDQHKQALKHTLQHQVTYDEALLRERLMSYQDLLQALQSRILFLVQTILPQQEGTVSYHTTSQLPRRYPTPPVSLAQVAYKTLRDDRLTWSHEKLEAALAPLRQRPSLRVDPPPVPMMELQLPEKEQRFYDKILAEKKTISTLLSITNLKKTHTIAVLLTFYDLGFLTFGKNLDTANQKQHIAEQILEEICLKQEMNHFEILGLHWSAYASLVDKAWKNSTHAWNLEQLPSSQRERITPELQKLHAQQKEAYTLLVDDKSRQQYRESIVSGIESRNAILHYFRQGNMNMMREEYEEAESNFKRVLELDRNHQEAREKLKLALYKRT